MLRRLHALYLRYTAVHSDRRRSVALGPLGRRWGQVEQVFRDGDQLKLVGWADRTELRLSWPDGEAAFTPDIPRPDVARRHGGAVNVGFEVGVPYTARALRLLCAGDARAVTIPHPEDPLPRAANRRLQRAFLRDVLRACPALAGYATGLGDPAQHRLTIKRALRLDLPQTGHPLDAGWLRPASPPARPAIVTIIVPVFNALDLVKACLDRVERHSDLPWHLIAVEDGSTDPAVRPWLRTWVDGQGDRVTLIEHAENEGFVGSVNDGLAAAKARPGDGPVVLLNTDAMVPENWLSRLTGPLSDPGVASVTPMSNAAEICSVPAIGRGCALRNGEGDVLDRVARGLSPIALPDLPTGIGFCMAMSAAWLARVPTFDRAFGRGYGEEVDWCQKVRALGGRHLCQPRLFVEHVGGQSFGAADKVLQLRRAGAQISRRYPDYDADVQRWIAGDPLSTPRLALGIALAGQWARPLPVFLAHSLGGGAEHALQAEIAQAPAAVVLRVGGARRWRIELHLDGQRHCAETDDLTLIRDLLAPVDRVELIYSCGVGDRDPVSLPDALLSLRRGGRGDLVAMRVHDYFPISPSYTLLGANDLYKGVPALDESDPAHTTRRPDGGVVALPQWCAAWGALVEASHEVVAFSPSSLRIMQAAYPDARLRLRPHRIATRPAPVCPSHLPQQCIGILGHLNRQKGAHVLQRMAEAHPDVAFVVIGHVDSHFAMPRNVTIHGEYAPGDITHWTRHYRITQWIMPSIWPETFSFVTHEALATGLPVTGFALGAQGEALEEAALGHTVPLHPFGTAPERMFNALLRARSHPPTAEVAA
ncbi:glycosyltransferase [Hasllibacter sp. MH4015]|uniref:glycosyltransferase n=1 Tax=Hasllibacter sp. MH4015 TaxID=2854029 RepID=UPI001CD7127E|nr:glycosyltransferase [Hasllibacter sp. MH4015]